MGTRLDRFADRKPSWDTPVIIESHINGVRTKEMNPNTPISYDEIAEDAIRCWDAGACAIHAHNTNFDLKGKDAYDDYMKTWQQVLDARPDMIWYPTTCNNLLCKEHEHGLEHLTYLNDLANVQAVPVDPGIELFAFDEDDSGHIVGREYGWNHQRIAGQVDLCRERDIAMIWGVYEPGHLRTARNYVNRGMFTRGSWWDFYLIGDYGLTATKPIATLGAPPTLETLYFYLDMIEESKYQLPWCISIWGEGDIDYRPIIKRTIELGGHVKTGLELTYNPNKNPTNLELLQEAQEIAREVGRPLATQEEAKEIYNIT